MSGCGLLGVLLWGLRRDAATLVGLRLRASSAVAALCLLRGLSVVYPQMHNGIIYMWRLCACFGVFGLGGKYFYDGLTSTALPAMVFDVKTTSAARPQTGDSLRVSCFTLGQQAGAPVGESHGGGGARMA